MLRRYPTLNLTSASAVPGACAENSGASDLGSTELPKRCDKIQALALPPELQQPGMLGSVLTMATHGTPLTADAL